MVNSRIFIIEGGLNRERGLFSNFDSEGRGLLEIKTAFTRYRHILKTVKNVTDRPPVHTKTAHFLPADFENGRF